MLSHKLIFSYVFAAIALTACVSLATSPKPTSSATLPATASFTPTKSPTGTPIKIQASPTPSEIPATPIPSVKICSPLADLTLSELPQILQYPMATPHPGQDDGHFGVDLAYYTRGDRKTMEGDPVLSVLAGQVSSIVNDRMPYGNAIIIESPLDSLPESLSTALALPTPAPTIPPDPRMANCPASGPVQSFDYSHRSLYLLYAHLYQPSPLKPGDGVICGQEIGGVGTTGLSSNPHLHFELRVGPAGARFNSMAYYDAAATEEENQNYCTWRVSGLFQILDPMKLLSIQP
jgi:murein DD-endopeptidase MepM/ murein hydrolase activator NlpD